MNKPSVPPSDFMPMPGSPLRKPTPVPAPAPFNPMENASLSVVTYGPDGKSYGSPLEARNAGVSNPTMSQPAGFKKGGAINLKDCKVSTHKPSSKKSSW
jgi:hypothetical protein